MHLQAHHMEEKWVLHQARLHQVKAEQGSEALEKFMSKEKQMKVWIPYFLCIVKLMILFIFKMQLKIENG